MAEPLAPWYKFWMHRLLVIFLFAAALSAQTPTVAGVQNVADFSTNLSPGVTAVIYGTNFGSGPASSATVTVGGKQGAVLLVTPMQINVQLPTDAPTGATTLTVTVGNATSAPFNLTLDAYSPAFFTADGSGNGRGLIITLTNGNIATTTPVNPGDTVEGFAVGLGPTNPPTPTGLAKAANPTAILPTLTVGGMPATVSFAGVAPNSVGLYQINFKVPAGLQGTQPVVLSIGGKSTTPVTLAISGISSVVSNASFASAGTAAPGSIVSVFANGFGTTDQSVGFPGTAFQGVSVLFNGTPAPLFHLTASQGQIDLLVPYELPTSGTVNVQLKTASFTSPNYALTMAPAVPGIYFLIDPSTKTRFNAIAQFNNTAWLAMPASMATALKISGDCTASSANPIALCAQPAAPGDYLVLYTTGLGKATPNGDPNGKTLATGAIPPADGSVLYQTVSMPTVTVGGFPAMVLFSGIAPGFPGEYQIDFQVPAGVTGDDVPVAVTMPGSTTDTRTISIHSR